MGVPIEFPITCLKILLPNLKAVDRKTSRISDFSLADELFSRKLIRPKSQTWSIRENKAPRNPQKLGEIFLINFG